MIDSIFQKVNSIIERSVEFLQVVVWTFLKFLIVITSPSYIKNFISTIQRRREFFYISVIALLFFSLLASFFIMVSPAALDIFQESNATVMGTDNVSAKAGLNPYNSMNQLDFNVSLQSNESSKIVINNPNNDVNREFEFNQSNSLTYNDTAYFSGGEWSVSGETDVEIKVYSSNNTLASNLVQSDVLTVSAPFFYNKTGIILVITAILVGLSSVRAYSRRDFTIEYNEKPLPKILIALCWSLAIFPSGVLFYIYLNPPGSYGELMSYAQLSLYSSSILVPTISALVISYEKNLVISRGLNGSYTYPPHVEAFVNMSMSLAIWMLIIGVLVGIVGFIFNSNLPFYGGGTIGFGFLTIWILPKRGQFVKRENLENIIGTRGLYTMEENQIEDEAEKAAVCKSCDQLLTEDEKQENGKRPDLGYEYYACDNCGTYMSKHEALVEKEED